MAGADGWDTEDVDEIVVGRRMHGGRRRSGAGRSAWVIALIVVILVGVGAVAYYWFNRPKPVASIPNPAVIAPGGFNATIGANRTITVGLEVRNTADIAVTLIEPRIVAPAGLTSTVLTIIPTGVENQGFAIDGPLPTLAPVQLGTDPGTRGAIIAARFSVDCAGLRAPGADLSEQIFIMVKVGSVQREEQLTPPVVGDVPWLAATAARVCADPVPTGTPGEQPLPPLPS